MIICIFVKAVRQAQSGWLTMCLLLESLQPVCGSTQVLPWYAALNLSSITPSQLHFHCASLKLWAQYMVPHPSHPVSIYSAWPGHLQVFTATRDFLDYHTACLRKNMLAVDYENKLLPPVFFPVYSCLCGLSYLLPIRTLLSVKLSPAV